MMLFIFCKFILAKNRSDVTINNCDNLIPCDMQSHDNDDLNHSSLIKMQGKTLHMYGIR